MIPKLIIFDMDGTLYDIQDVVAQNYKMQVDYLSWYLNKTKEETRKILAENNIYPTMSEKSKSATEFFLTIGIDKQEWSRYREEHYDLSAIDRSKAIKNDTIIAFARYTKVVLLSSNSYGGIKQTLSYLGIDITAFDDVVCSNYFEEGTSFNKYEAMQHISKKKSIPYSQMLSIGDRYQTDVVPMLKLGGKGIIIRKPKDLVQVLDDIQHNCLQSKDAYKYYESI